MLSFFCEAGFMTSIPGLWKEVVLFPDMPAAVIRARREAGNSRICARLSMPSR